MSRSAHGQHRTAHHRRLDQLGRQPAQRPPPPSLRPAPPTTSPRPSAPPAAAGGRSRPVGSGHSFTPVAATDGRRMELTELDTAVTLDAGRRLVTVPAGMPLHRAQRPARRHGLALPNLGDIDAQTVAGAIATGTHGTGAGVRLPVHLRRGARPGHRHRRGGALLAPTEHPDVFAAARVGLGALGVADRGDPALRGRLRAARRRAPAPLAEVLGRPGRALIAGQRPLRVLLVPVHRPGAVKSNNRVPADDRPLPRLARAGSTTTCWTTPCSAARAGSAGPCPRWPRRISAVSARALAARTYTGRVRPGLHHAAPGPVRGDGVRAAARRPARGVRRAAADRRRPAVQGALPGRGPVHRRRRHLALPRVRARQRVHRDPPVRRHALRAVLPGLRAGRHGAGRSAALGQAALARRRDPARAYPHWRTSSMSATAWTRTASSTPLTWPRSSAPDPVLPLPLPCRDRAPRRPRRSGQSGDSAGPASGAECRAHLGQHLCGIAPDRPRGEPEHLVTIAQMLFWRSSARA